MRTAPQLFLACFGFLVLSATGTSKHQSGKVAEHISSSVAKSSDAEVDDFLKTLHSHDTGESAELLKILNEKDEPPKPTKIQYSAAIQTSAKDASLAKLGANDPLKKDAAKSVEALLGLTEEQVKELAKEKVIATPVDDAVKACKPDAMRLGCKVGANAAGSSVHCLALAVKEQAAEISLNCREKTEASVQYGCSVELYTSHCDGIEKPIIECLQESATSKAKFSQECQDHLTVTKKVLKSLHVVKQGEAELPMPVVRMSSMIEVPPEQTPEHQHTLLIWAGLFLALFLGYSNTEYLQDFGYQMRRWVKKEAAAIPGLEHLGPAPRKAALINDWTTSCLDEEGADNEMSSLLK